MGGKLCQPKRCTGCQACVNICPTNAIRMVELNEGYLIPCISKKCIDCGKCSQVCSLINTDNGKFPHICYAMQRKDVVTRRLSSSGGVSYAISEEAIRRGWIVYGTIVSYKDCFVERFDSENELYRIRTSKYVQSDVGSAYSRVAEDLKRGTSVLFSGTPCQVAALKRYIKALGVDESGLYTIDLICHGVPPMKYLTEYLDSIHQDIDSYSFRGGDKDFYLKCFSKQKLVYSRICYKDPYYTAFLKGVIYREGCYDCQFARIERVGDVTLGDFQKIRSKILDSGNKSVVLVNTDKGEFMVDAIKELFLYEERSIREAQENNGQLNHPSKSLMDREKFLQRYDQTHNFNQALRDIGIGREMCLFYLKNVGIGAFLKTVRNRLMYYVGQ